MTKLIAFDLDGTLAKSKSEMDGEMAELIRDLLEYYYILVISGGAWTQFDKQFLAPLKVWAETKHMQKLYCMPTCGASMYRFHTGFLNGWHVEYSHILTPSDVARIYEAFYYGIIKAGHKFEAVYGQQIENRISQVTFSALGQLAPLELKGSWDPDGKKRTDIINCMREKLSDFEIRYGGTTSIDVTLEGIDKAFGIRKICEYLDLRQNEVIFVGDALYESGNDYPVKLMGVDCQEIKTPEDTKIIIKNLLNSQEKAGN